MSIYQELIGKQSQNFIQTFDNNNFYLALLIIYPI